MQSLRQIGLAIAVAVVSLGLVLGGLSLALSENVTPPVLPTETLWLPTFAEFITPTVTPEIQVLPTDTLPPTVTLTLAAPASCTPPSGWMGITVGVGDTLDSVAARYRTTASALAQANCLLTQSLVPGTVLFVPPLPVVQSTATTIPCGAPFGWVRYTVLSGDTLYHIATMFAITTSQLQQANCLGFSTNIRVGQLLWVPNRPPLVTNTPGLTLFPTFNPPTEAAYRAVHPDTAARDFDAGTQPYPCDAPALKGPVTAAYPLP